MTALTVVSTLNYQTIYLNKLWCLSLIMSACNIHNAIFCILLRKLRVASMGVVKVSPLSDVSFSPLHEY